MRFFEPTDTDFEALRREFQWRIPRYFNIAQAVCDRHRVQGRHPALFYENVAGQGRTYTFNDLYTGANRLANGLSALGIERGDRVGIVLPQRFETGLAHVACYKLGAVAVPLSVLFGSDALEFRLRDSGARAVFSVHPHTEFIMDIKSTLPELRTVIGCDGGGDTDVQTLLDSGTDACETMRTRADDPALLIYTSGTTGAPKGAQIAHRALFGNLPGFELSQNFFPEPQDVFWTPADWAWTGGLLDGLLPAWAYGRPIVAFEGRGRFDAERAVELVERYGVSNAFIPPTALKMLRQLDDIGRYRLRLRAIMSAGEQLGAEVFEWGKQALGLAINEMWGQTEFNYLVGNCARIMPVMAGSMGKPYPGHRVEVIDSEGNPLPAGEVGELAAHTDDPVMFLGYWKRERATREKIVGDWFLTGDLGYRDAEGYLWFVGRKDDVISSAGHRIGPGEIEDCLLLHEAVAQAAVIGRPDALRGEIVKAYIVLADGFTPSTELKRTIQDVVRQRRSAYEYPREIEFLDEIPMTTTGKVRRAALRLRDREARSSG